MSPFRTSLSALLPASILTLAVTAPADAQSQNSPQRDAAGRNTVTESITTQERERLTADAHAGDAASLQLNLGWELADTDEGVRVEKIEANSAAAKAHLEEGDVIVKINDENVLTLDRVQAVLENVQQDDDVNITVRRDGEELSYLLPLEEVAVVQTRRTTRSEQNLTEMLQLIQQQLQAQQATLDAILLEMQSRQSQPLNVRSTTSTNVPPAAGYAGDIIAPLGAGTGGTTPSQPQAPGDTGSPNPRPDSPAPR